MHERTGQVVERPVDRRGDHADPRLAAAEVLLGAQDRVVREGFHGALLRPGHFRRDGLEEPERQAAPGSPRELCRGGNGSRRGGGGAGGMGDGEVALPRP